ncbi:MAG: glycoside hydrolase family 127 protein, partial [Spirochaetales bacterium]|nr:glycoside hydrolase family 127 protein [Spirochaetales bacterium]
NIFLNWRLLHLNARAAHADRIEQSFYNLVLASVSRDGLRYFYSNPLAREEKQLPFHLKWERSRSEYLSSFCCPPNMLRVLSQSSEYAYSQAEDGIYTVMYGQSRASLQVGNNHVVLEQTTAYPYDGSITITIEETDGTPFTLYVRIPSWVKQGRIQNQDVTAEMANTYLPLRSDWKQGDVITIEFAMEARILLAHPLVEECTHQVAVMRGPLVYCSEQVDHPQLNWASLGLRQNAHFTAVTRTIGGESMLCLQTEDGVAYQMLDWETSGLYQDASGLMAEPTTLSLIPYYAWDNRGLGGMKIWHPLYLS